MNYILKSIFALAIVLFSVFVHAYSWSESEALPIEGLSNPINYTADQLPQVIRAGRLHALNYPVTVTGSALPYTPFKKILDKTKIGIDGLGRFLGLHSYPESEGVGPYFIPFLNHQKPSERMGFTRLQTPQGEAITFSCAACHSANLFGRRVIGLTNRFPRANDTFIKGKKALAVMDSTYLRLLTGASKSEIAMYLQTKENLRSVEAKKPQALGLDTSLAHVALSLSHRGSDEWATQSREQYKNPRAERLRDNIGDSKPAVWWNVKYKNKWLLDGSVVSGNPIYTNLIWNEIGRGTDLHRLKNWLDQNQQIIDELTTAVYQSEAPSITDYFNETYFDLQSAKRGEKLFNQTCSRCHGTYEKAWSSDKIESLSLKDQFKTTKVNYFAQTPVIDVGTDEKRREAMSSLLQLNNLKISKEKGIVIRLQKGYVPPPLVGIWARYPYMHNNSIASLCDLLTPAAERPQFYVSREANDTKKDFDFNCNGYPVVERIHLSEAVTGHVFSNNKPGTSNKGHDRMFTDSSGQSIYTAQERKDLIHYLQSL